MGHIQGQCRDVDECDDQARRAAETIERSTEETRDSSTAENGQRPDGKQLKTIPCQEVQTIIYDGHLRMSKM